MRGSARPGPSMYYVIDFVSSALPLRVVSSLFPQINSKMQGLSKTGSDLPEVLVLEILSKLPVKSLTRFS
ncbi:hypothetical protein HRI_002969600 [Hibiscus trionum]|uniref:F-box domain-containing protein n=1 Tax=Hibiscus trionum TaxID=183268 RepID=A0A9W7M9C4_HIBTR|nr:hypothetical protein HRI_002969600 [Hibiscus trionum]